MRRISIEYNTYNNADGLTEITFMLPNEQWRYLEKSQEWISFKKRLDEEQKKTDVQQAYIYYLWMNEHKRKSHLLKRIVYGLVITIVIVVIAMVIMLIHCRR